MTLTPLSAISPIDGRYRNTTSSLAAYFSEYALIRYRVFVEVEYFIALYKHPIPQLQNLDTNVAEKLRDIYKNFNEADAENINYLIRRQLVSCLFLTEVYFSVHCVN